MTTKADFLEKVRKIYGQDIEICYPYDLDKEVDEEHYIERYKKLIKNDIYLIFQITFPKIDEPYALNFDFSYYNYEDNKQIIINPYKILDTLSQEADKLNCVINFAQDTILKAIKG